MFKIPEWEKDVPKGTDTFGRNTKKKKETLSGKPLNKSDPENNKKSSILNRIDKHKSKKVKHIKKYSKQRTPINKIAKSVNYANTKNVNGIKGKLKNKTKKADKIKKILKTIGNVETDNGEQNETAYVKKFVKSQLENKRKNGKLLNTHKQIVETEITASNHKLNGDNYPNKSVHDLKNKTGSKNKSKKRLDNEISLPLSNSHIQSNVNKKGLKRKYNNKTDTGKDPDADSSLEGQNLNSDLLDEAIINAKKKKLSEAFENDDREDLLFAETKQNMVNTMNNKEKFTNKNKVNSKAIINGKTASDKKKESIKKLLENESHRRPINISGNNLRTRMMERLKAAQFRYLNEKLYTSSGSDAQTLFQSDPAAFQTYHEGYKQQLKKWPVNPLDFIVKRIQKMPKSCMIADMGCGEAALAKRIPHTVRSFDLVAKSHGVEACDMAHTPLLSASIDVAVYCLALMGTDLTQYLVEANRVLKTGGHLLIAEVESRFDKVEDFTKEVERLGFKLKKLDNNNNVFLYMEFTKTKDPPVKKSKLPVLTLKPCMYKKR